MGAMHVELPEDLVGPIESKASEFKTDASRFVAAIVREKPRLPVKIGEPSCLRPLAIDCGGTSGLA